MSTTPRRFPEQIFITNSTNSNNLITGSLVTSGGLGLGSNLSIGGSSLYFGANANYSGLTAPSTNPASNVLLRLPNALPVNPGSFLQCDTSGNLSFTTGVMNTFSIASGSIIPPSGTITGLLYTTGQFDIIVTVQITGGNGNLTQLFRLTGVLSNLGGWSMSSIAVSGDNTQFSFTINSGTGQISYTASGTYGIVTSAIISWSNYQSFPNATGVLTIPTTTGNTLIVSSTSASSTTVLSNSISTLGGIGVTGDSYFGSNIGIGNTILNNSGRGILYQTGSVVNYAASNNGYNIINTSGIGTLDLASISYAAKNTTNSLLITANIVCVRNGTVGAQYITADIRANDINIQSINNALCNASASFERDSGSSQALYIPGTTNSLTYSIRINLANSNGTQFIISVYTLSIQEFAS